jgi:hypothetical protein
MQAGPRGFNQPLTYVTADGKTLPGVFLIARIDLAASPPLPYPPISVRLNEQGEAAVSSHVMADGNVVLTQGFTLREPW